VPIEMTLEYANKLRWGTRGKSGREPMRMVELGDCDTNHLENIYQHLLEVHHKTPNNEYCRAVKCILDSRKVQCPDLPEDLFTI